MRVALADYSGIFLDGLSAVLTAVGLEVVFAGKDGDSLLAYVDNHSSTVDCVISDLRMPPSFTDEGRRVVEHIKSRHASIGVLLLSAFMDPSVATSLLERHSAGVGYLLKDHVNDVADLRASMQRIQDGEVVIDSSIVQALLQRRRPDEALSVLSAREIEVLKLVAEGYSNAGIGQTLELSERTVENHVGRIFAKLEISSDSRQNRRVLTVLTWRRAVEDSLGDPTGIR